MLVTGTDTGVGKTIVTAAVAAAAQAADYTVAVLKPAESGVVAGAGVESDVDVVARLAAPRLVRTLVSYPDPLAPLTAARQSGLPELAIGDVIEAVEVAGHDHELVLVEGSGGLLVPMGEGGWTVADLAVALRIPAVVVARSGLGTLNHIALTFEAMAHRGIPGWLVLGSWPAEPELVHWTNLADLRELAGVLPQGAGSLPADRFQAAAPRWLTPALFGQADPDVLLADAISLPPPGH
ncbi:MAG TPA: dethiobiotin synthase [Rugosimonospora sp.]|nr:dethiobiotin synthase [Rugosimonospora sp.]